MRQLRDESVEIQYLVFKVFSVLKKKADSIFKKHGLTGAQVGVLSRLIEKKGKPMNKISEELWCDVSNITGVVDRLEKQGLVRRATHPDDRRIYLVSITSKGKKALAKTIPRHEKVLIDRIQKLSPEERKTLIKLLNKIIE